MSEGAGIEVVPLGGRGAGSAALLPREFPLYFPPIGSIGAVTPVSLAHRKKRELVLTGRGHHTPDGGQVFIIHIFHWPWHDQNRAKDAKGFGQSQEMLYKYRS